MEDALLVSVAICGSALVIAVWVWNFVFGKSLRRMIMTFITIGLNRDMIVDPNAPIEPLTEEQLSDILEDRAAQLKTARVVDDEPSRKPPQALVPPNERGEKARDTSDSGWPRNLDVQTRRSKHPFRQVHLSTENEQSHEIMDVDTYEKTHPDEDGIMAQDKEQEDL